MTKFDMAMAESDELIGELRSTTLRDHPLLMAFIDLWKFRHNVPIVTTIYETYQEMISPVRQVGNRKH